MANENSESNSVNLETNESEELLSMLPPCPNSNKEELKTFEIPSYLTDVYNWAYVKPKNIDFLDRPLSYHIILFGQGWKLMEEYLKEINEGTKMLQIAHVYGNIIPEMVKKIGTKGHLDVIDAVPYQLERLKTKLQGIPHSNVEMWVQDASTIFHREYNTIGIYFLLHEVPNITKIKIIDNALKAIKETNGKLIFIDYHNPAAYNPVRPILKLVNTFLEPFAHVMWSKEIKDFANNADEFNWEKTTYFMGAYQKVVVTKK